MEDDEDNGLEHTDYDDVEVDEDGIDNEDVSIGSYDGDSLNGESDNNEDSTYQDGGSGEIKYNEGSDNEYDSDDNYEKFDEEIKKSYILKKHPEIIQKNYNEIEVLTRIQRNSENMIIDENHQTIPILTKYEKTKVLGMRIKQLNHGSEPYIKTGKNILDSHVIAMEELNQKKLPFIIARPLNKDKTEYWNINDLELLH